ncbi:hypothetical protein [Neorhizobium galegae]|uniref:hypothetical protein n=1 Tax=Neorhizobium galegae TaxID=399 RepID=UPI0021077DE9|nr:hypothetical protein [Neorhizobium galegae]MCQ1850369.1 hypothetical protein [Neorhizobium galegae]
MREQILIYRLLIADIERRHPPIANKSDIALGPNADELQHLLNYRASLTVLERFTETRNAVANQ